MNPSGSGEADLIRLTTIPYDNEDNMMSGFASCIDCGRDWQGGEPYMGLDRAACNGHCNNDQIGKLRDSASGQAPDCRGDYCDSSYGGNVRAAWNSRIFVREETPITPEILQAMADCTASGKHYAIGSGLCVDDCKPPECTPSREACEEVGMIFYKNQDDQRCVGGTASLHARHYVFGTQCSSFLNGAYTD